jgi:hypothetical protein
MTGGSIQKVPATAEEVSHELYLFNRAEAQPILKRPNTDGTAIRRLLASPTSVGRNRPDSNKPSTSKLVGDVNLFFIINAPLISLKTCVL